MQRERQSTLFQIGVGLFLIGVAIKVAIWLGALLGPFAGIAIVVGVILAIIGLAMPGRRR